ncbi:head GIN domain-containing protein [Sphingomonas sp. MMS24-J45]|uniref:head GIN domain-containing protein n=1 Tax=Sphingomonas sp. MMS24-J45 TaxID=3238806 RepID=UPI00384AE806
MNALPLLILVPLAACSAGADTSGPGVPGSGSGTTRTYAVSDFSALALRGSDDVDVRVGTGFSVRAEGPSKELDKVKIERVGDTLRIGRHNRNGFSWGSSDNIKVYVTMPRIVGATVAGSGNMTVDRVEGQRFTIDAAGSGNLTVAMLAVREAKVSIAGSGDITLKGSADRLSVDVAGSGDVNAANVKAAGAAVNVLGSGSVRAEVNGQASVSMMGSGDVDLGKGATCSISKMGSGEVKCGK